MKKKRKCFPKIPADGMLNGSVQATFARCGKPNCKCAHGELHGPYYHRYQRIGDRIQKEYIPLAYVEEVRAACARYRKLQDELREGRQHFEMLLSRLRSNMRELNYE
jgi:hypothetical protein